MKRATIKILSFSKIKPQKPQISPKLTSQISPTLNSTPPQQISSNTQFKNSPKFNPFHFSNPKTHQFNKNPSQKFTTIVEIPHKLPSRQQKIKERSKVEEQFEEATTHEEMLEIFKEMEASFDEKDLGLACLKIGLKLDQQGEDPQKIESFALRALKSLNFDDNNNCSLPIAMTLQLLGSVNYSLKKFNDALGYLNMANKMIIRLKDEGGYGNNDILPILHAVHIELANTKTAMGRREESLENLRKAVEIKEVLMGKDSKEVGVAYRDYADACIEILNFKEGLKYCLKALELHIEVLGKNSVEVAYDRRALGVIYTGLEEHEKALEQNELARKVLRSWGRGSDLLRAEIDAANMYIALGKFDKAIETLRGAVQETEKDSEYRGLILITMAKALVNEDKYADAKRCLEIASGILEKKEKVKPFEVAEGYMEISMQYEAMNEFEIAISLLKRAQALLERLPQEQHTEGSVSARIGWLLLLTGKVTQAIPYLESGAETLKASFGPKHFGVGYIYNNLGAAYLELERPQSAAQMFGVAKDIMDSSLGPHHTDSIEASQNLSKAYAAMGSYDLAIEFQQKAVDAWTGHGETAEDELREALRILKELKMKALDDSSPKGSSTKALPLPQSSNPNRSLQPNQLPNTTRSQ